MIHKFLLLLIVPALMLACASHSPKAGQENRPRSEKELKLVNEVQLLADETEGLVKQSPPELSPSIAPLAENTERLKNTSLRFGPNSLEARDALDKVRFHAEQLDKIMTNENYPKLMGMWKKIRADIDSISKQLGYRVGDNGY